MKIKFRIFAKNIIFFLALFGSILTSHFKSTSDVDILVKFDKENTPTLFDLVGRQVDLKTPYDLSPHFRDDVIAHAQVI